MQGQGPRKQEATLRVSEVKTSLMLFQTSGFRNFKTFYLTACLPASYPGLSPPRELGPLWGGGGRRAGATGGGSGAPVWPGYGPLLH